MGGRNVQLGLALGAEEVAVLAAAAAVVGTDDAFLGWSHMDHEGNCDLSVVSGE